jgi:lysyl endopeptidase
MTRTRADASARLSVLLVILLAAVIAGTGSASAGPSTDMSPTSIDSEVVKGAPTAEEMVAAQTNLHEWLMTQLPSGVTGRPVIVSLTRVEKHELADMQEAGGNEPAVIGRTKTLARAVRFSKLEATLRAGGSRRLRGGVFQAMPDGGFVWAAAFRSVDAGAVRLHITHMDLPSDADLFLLTTDGQAFGPYSKKGPNDDGDFWTNTTFGSDTILLLRHYGPDGAADLKQSSFRVEELGHIGPHFTPIAVAQAFCSFNVPCIENASCHNGTPADSAKSATALMQWIAGAFIYTCTGTLLNDTVSTSQIPYFLTANHCISSSSNASNLQAYFQFSLSCGSTNCPAQTNPGGIQRLGSTVKTTGTTGDFTLLQLNQTPPAGSVFMGWNNTPIANTNNAALYRISHPAWAPQAYSDGHVDTSAPTCTGWPRGERIYSRTTTGGTEGGSSGSAVLNSSGQVVGQLSGACGTNTGNACDNTNNATVDGAFASYYASVQPFLAPSSCVPVTEVCNDGIDNDCDNQIDCADSNCTGSPSCGGGCSPAGASCTTNSQCCSNKCRGPAGSKSCR